MHRRASSAEIPASPAQAGPGGRTLDRRSAALFCVLCAAFMGVLDTFVVSIALPVIQSDLHASAAELQLVIVAYVVPYAGFLILGGRTGDRYGHGRVFLLAVAGFALTSASCGLAPTAPALIAARAAQGTCAAFMLPQALALIRTLFDDEQGRLRAMGRYAATLGLAATSGHLLGGLIMLAAPQGLAWRAVFLINLPFAALAVTLGAYVLPRHTKGREADVEWTSAALQTLAAALALGAIVAALGRTGPTSSVLALGAAAGAAAAGLLFMARQAHVIRSGGEPLLPPRLLRDRLFRKGLLAVFLYYVAACLQVILVYHLQRSLGLRPLAAAVVLVPYAASFTFVSLLASRALTRAGPSLVWRAVLLTLVPVTLLGAVIWLPPSATPVAMAIVLLPLGALQGLIAGPMLSSVLGRIATADAGVGSGILLTSLQFANAAGVAAIGGVYFRTLAVLPAEPAVATTLAIGACMGPVALAAVLLRSLDNASQKHS